jgi:hypothetical protein
VLKQASDYAVRVMRSGRGLADPPAPFVAEAAPAVNGNGTEAPSEVTRPTPEPSEARPPSRLAELLAKQARLALDTTPAGEARYNALVAEIAQLQ